MIKSFIDFMKDRAEAEDESSKETDVQDTKGTESSVSGGGVSVQDDNRDTASPSEVDGTDTDTGDTGDQD